MSVQALPVRLAETVNRFGSPRLDRVAAGHPTRELVLVTVGDRSFLAQAYGERVTRRGRQRLVSVHGRLVWIAGHRVQALPESG